MTRDEVRVLFDYNPDDGQLRWRDRARGRKDGGIVGTPNKRGYLATALIEGGRRKNYYIHRLIWLWVYGEWPSGDLDHRNLDKTDNRLANLRPASESENVHNQRARNKIGFKGVWQQNSGRWSATITKNRRRIYLGIYDTPELASAAYYEAAKQLHGEFARRL